MPDSTAGPQPDKPLKLMETYKGTNSNDAATKLLAIYEPLVTMSARKVSRNRPDLYEDLFQVGQMSLLQLFKKYDRSLGYPFEAYAVKSLIGYLKNYLRDKSWYIQVPRQIKEKGLLVQQAIDDLTIQLERSPTMDEIAEYVGLSLEETIEVMAGSENYTYIPLDAPLTSDDQSATVGELIGNPLDEFNDIEKRLDLEAVLDQLKTGEKEILHLLYHCGCSQRDVAEQLGISQMSVSRIHKRAIERLKAKLN
jgi:RNA polymerase sigma-B factor